MEKDLRLRLVVRRHGVPDVKLLWNATADEDLTISKLLNQINEVIPLESGEWGLEDYAVELKDASGDGFECVHYHLVSKVLKDDDQVLVRPLLTGDLKRRRLSGRHQISADGRHLVDGLAFGRSWLRAPRDRPAVTLPPRKKARIAYSSEEEEEEDSPSENDGELPMLEYESTRAQEDPASVKLRTRFYDADPDSNSEDEDDFEPAADGAEDDDTDFEDDDVQDELRMLKEDNAAVREGDILEELRDIQNKRVSNGAGSSRRSLKASDGSPAPLAGNALVRSIGRPARHRLDLDTLDKIAALRVAFPGAQVSAIEQTLLRYGTDAARAYRKLRKTFIARLSLQQTLDHQARSLSSSPIRYAGSNAGRELVLRESSPSERASHAMAHGQEDEDEDGDVSVTLNHNAPADRDVRSDESSGSGSDPDSETESSSGSSVAGVTTDLDREPNDSSDDDEEEDDDNDLAPSSSDDDDDSDDDDNDASSEPEGGEPVVDEENEDSPDPNGSSSDDDSSSDGSSSDGPSRVAAKEHSSKYAVVSVSSSDSLSDSSPEDSSSEDSSSDSSSDSEPEEIPSKTLSSQRRILEPSQPSGLSKAPQTVPAAAATQTQEQPNVPPGQGLSKTQKRNARRKLAKQLATRKSSASVQGSEEPLQVSATGVNAEEAAFLARKQALLNAIASNGLDDPFDQEMSQGTPASAPQQMEIDQVSAAVADAADTSQSSAVQAGDTSAQRRMRPNIGATRRMLMGSLGLKNPKTKADEDKIRSDLMKGVRPHTNARLTEAAPQPDESALTQESVEEDPEAWREKIAYRAVECCHDGVELSEPPFPFVQRWDPQQQVEEWFGSNNKRGGKRKRAQRNQAQYQEDGDSQASKKRRLTGESLDGISSEAVGSLEEGDTMLNYDDPLDDPPAAKPAAEGRQTTDIDDLPPLPSDLTTLPDLRSGEAKLGMVITWKQWLLSSATNWQPEVVNLTGILVRVHDENATDLEVLLAQRDRDVDRTEKKYDEETGERLYDRFEAPDDDEDVDGDDEPDQGYRRLNYTDLIEPKILQLPSGDQAKEICNEGSSADPTDSVIHETVYDDQSQPSQINQENVGQSEADTDGSQLQLDAMDGQAKANTNDGQPQVAMDSDSRLDATSRHDQIVQNPHAQVCDAKGIDEENVPTPRISSRSKEENPVPTPEDADSQNSTMNALSISSDRRHEISIMMEEAGFHKHVSPSVIRRKTSSPSRQLLEMSEAASTSRVVSRSPVSRGSMAEDTMPAPENNGDTTVGVTGEGSAASPSSASSIRSGRQPDPDNFSFDAGGDDLPRISDTGHGSPILDAPASKSKAQTPTRVEDASDPPSTGKSFPSLESLFRTASQMDSRKNTQSPSKSQSLSAVEPRGSIVQRDEDYEVAMRQIDEAVEDEGDGGDESSQALEGTRKQLFPNSSCPGPSSLSESPDLPEMNPIGKSAPSFYIETQDTKPQLLRQQKRKGSSFVVPPGSQVVTLSSSPSGSPSKDDHAEDGFDADHQDNDKSSSLPHGSSSVQKNKPPRANPRANSRPATRVTTRSASARKSMTPSSMPANSGMKAKGQRKSMTKL